MCIRDSLEAMGRAGNLENAAEEFRALEHELRNVNQELLAIAAKPGNKPAPRRTAPRKKRKK